MIWKSKSIRILIFDQVPSYEIAKRQFCSPNDEEVFTNSFDKKKTKKLDLKSNHGRYIEW